MSDENQPSFLKELRTLQVQLVAAQKLRDAFQLELFKEEESPVQDAASEFVDLTIDNLIPTKRKLDWVELRRLPLL